MEVIELEATVKDFLTLITSGQINDYGRLQVREGNVVIFPGSAD
jgi:hypothetical protein